MLCCWIRNLAAQLRRWFCCDRRRPVRLNLVVDVVIHNEERGMAKEVIGTAGLHAVRIIAKPRGAGQPRALEPGTFKAISSNSAICADGVLILDGEQDGEGNFVYEVRAPILGDGECDLEVSGDADPDSGQVIIGETVHVIGRRARATDLNNEVDVVEVTPA